MERNMSMSIMLDNKKNISDISIPKTTPIMWIPSENVTNCYNCGINFSLLNRKHHCRMCGRIFCNNCSCNCCSSNTTRESKSNKTSN